MERTPHFFIVCNEAWSLTGALEEVPQGFSTIGESGSGSGHS
jgi:hypothetical protein